MKNERKNRQDTALDRRRFLRLAGAAAAGGTAAAVMPAWAKGADKREPFSRGSRGSGRGFWQRISHEFLLDPRTTYMNIGTTGSMPRHVIANYDRYNKLVARDPWDMGGEWGRWPYMSELVERVAPQMGADTHEIILTRNTTDGMCTVLEGLNLQPGDEVLYTHHEHVAGTSPLHVLQQRFGVTLTKVEIPVLDATEQAYVDAFANAVSPATRLIVFSHITYKTGVRLPAKRICREVAVPNGIPTLIDGAHAIGMIELDFHDMDCDFYAGSGHKWQCGPSATGILYVRDNLGRLRDYWSDRAEVFWPINSSLAEYPFFGLQLQLQYVGNDNRCQPWRAKRRLVDPSSREAALFSRRALRQRENKVGLRTRRPVIGRQVRSSNELAKLLRSAW
ncbi:aminotransferase class V-fold PLP-dependent enzyme [Thiolapillus sp.]|uniref:aminotransferase class V-fold PLP-dependent enzyme n=5 Tax=Thiolapillus sp. TaxID=2017437 RepID=UPI003AF6B9A1